MGSELDKPLGQNRKPASGNARRGRRRWRAPATSAAAVLIVTIGSLYAALLPNAIGKGDVSQNRRPVDATATATVPPGKLAGGSAPLVGKSAEPTGLQDDASPARQDGMSGAAVQHTLTSNGLTVTKISPGKRSDDGPVVIEAGRRIGQDPYIASQPEPDLYASTKYGKLPVRSERGARAMDVYARPAPDGGGTRIAIVVGGLGLSQTGTMNAIDELPEGVTLAFASNGNSLQRWMQAARRAGHEVLLQVPMEPFGYPDTDPGPHTLTVKGGKAADLDDLHYAMGRITNYTGIMNYMGGRFMADAGAMEPVMRDLANRGLLFLDDGSSAQSLTGKIAPTLGVPYATANVQLDADVNRGSILKKLDELGRMAQRNGSAIGVASAFDQSVQAIASWANEAKARGIEIVGVSALVNDPEHAE